MDFYLTFLADNWWRIIITAVIAYLLGSINTAVIVTKIVTGGKKDIREMGSGNAGFTNVLRSVGKLPAIFTIVCDALKCVVAVIIGWLIFSGIPAESQILSNEFGNCGKYIAGIFSILGHSYPVYFHFKGGKGVVTAAALIASEDWRVFIAIIAVFLIVFVCSKIISLSSITAAALYGRCVCNSQAQGQYKKTYAWRGKENYRKEKDKRLTDICKSCKIMTELFFERSNNMSDCIFCKIVDGSIPSTKVYEDDKILAFKDLNPQAPVHTLIVPKQHICCADKITSENCEIVGYIFSKIPEIAKSLGLENGYRIVNNCGEDGCQTVKHLR